MDHVAIFQTLIADQKAAIDKITNQTQGNTEAWAKSLDKLINRYDKAVSDLQDAEDKIPMHLLNEADDNNNKLIDEYEMI